MSAMMTLRRSVSSNRAISSILLRSIENRGRLTSIPIDTVHGRDSRGVEIGGLQSSLIPDRSMLAPLFKKPFGRIKGKS
jgi:hypothetical protein